MFKTGTFEELPEVRQRQKLPWDSLKEIGDYFVIETRNGPAFKYARQSVYARNRSKEALKLGHSYKAILREEGMVIYRSA